MSQIVYPVRRGSWYVNKGYKDFDEFVQSQQGGVVEKKVIFDDMRHVNTKRAVVDVGLSSGMHAQLDTVALSPNATIDSQNKPGKGKHIIYFFGRNEPYETKYREMLQDAKEIGVTVHAFNLPGMHDSTGEMLEFSDAVNSGIAQVNTLLIQGIKPDDIILKGNCFGASIASEVQHVASVQGVQIRNINSNSYRTFKAVILEAIPGFLKSMAQVFLKALDYTGWSTNAEEKILQQNPYTCVIHRVNDRTIQSAAKLQTAISKFQEGVDDPNRDFNKKDLRIKDFEQSQEFLEKYNVMHLREDAKEKDSHKAQVKELYWTDTQGTQREFHEFINEYIARSNEYIQAHPQPNPPIKIQPVGEAEYVKPSSETIEEFEKLEQKIDSEENTPEAPSRIARLSM